MAFRTLVLCDAVAHDGGTESYLARIIPALRSHDVDVVVRARTVRESDAFGVGDTQRIAWASDEEAPNAAAASAVERTIAALAPDAVILSNVFDPGVVAAARRAPRFVVRVHDHRNFCPNGNRVYPQFSAACTSPMGGACVAASLLRGCVHGPRPSTLVRLQRRRALQRALLEADAFVVSSRYMRTSCIDNGVPAHAVVTAPPPVDPRALAAPALSRSGRRRVLFAGRIAPEKGLRSLISALAHIPAARRPELDVAGAATPEARAAAAHAERLAVTARFLGRLDGSALQAAYDGADVVAVPSLWPEPFGLVGIEAFARGRPVVAYDVGGVREWIGAGGIAVPRGDELAFSQALVAVLDDGRWEAFAFAARRAAEAYTTEAHVTTLLTTLTPTLSKERPCAY
jgi:glycosyltransferase involved in cell wall biosynthesis